MFPKSSFDLNVHRPQSAWAHCILACLWLVLGAGWGLAQETRNRPLIVELSEPGFVSFKAEARDVSPVARALAWPAIFTPQFFLDEGNVIHRVLADKEGAFVFGYDLVVTPLADKKQFQVAVRPLSADFAERLHKLRQTAGAARTHPALNIPTLSATPDVQMLDDGDAFALDLLVNAQLGIKIVDVVKLSFDRIRLLERPSVPPRDFSLDKVELAVKDFRLFINGADVTGQNRKRDCEGALVWFYVTGRGRFVFSLVPRAGYEFQKIAVVEDNKISFALDGDYYEWESEAPIVPGGGHWNLWVMRDPDYDVPEMFGTVDKRPPAEIAGALDETPLALPHATRANPNVNTFSVARPPANRKKPWWSLPIRLLIRIGGSDRIESLLPKALRTPFH